MAPALAPQQKAAEANRQAGFTQEPTMRERLAEAQAMGWAAGAPAPPLPLPAFPAAAAAAAGAGSCCVLAVQLSHLTQLPLPP